MEAFSLFGVGLWAAGNWKTIYETTRVCFWVAEKAQVVYIYCSSPQTTNPTHAPLILELSSVSSDDPDKNDDEQGESFCLVSI